MLRLIAVRRILSLSFSNASLIVEGKSLGVEEGAGAAIDTFPFGIPANTDPVVFAPEVEGSESLLRNEELLRNDVGGDIRFEKDVP